jgi:FkbM family methyltransferase
VVVTRAIRAAHLRLAYLGLRLTFPRRWYRQRLLLWLMRSPLGYLRSAYGPYLVNRGPDQTYRTSLRGAYGSLIPDAIAVQQAPFTFIDIGANTGVFSLVAAADQRCERAVAFEPNPNVYRNLEENIRLNHAAVTAYPLGISSGEPGTRVLHVPPQHSGAATLRTLNLPPVHNPVSIEVVNRHFLDELAIDVHSNVICKIDVEGHEPEVLDELFASQLGPLTSSIIIECDDRFTEEGIGGIERRLQAQGFERVRRTRGRPDHFDALWLRTLDEAEPEGRAALN